MITIEMLKQTLPHRYPFLLVDRILELDPGKRAVGLKNVTFNEPFFQGHFPSESVMPGVLILETMAQTGGYMIVQGHGLDGKISYLTGVDKAKFRRLVVPGDQLIMTVELLKIRGRMGKVSAVAHVDGAVAAEAELSFALAEPLKKED